MRPSRLELSGFTAFRDPVVIDFAGADLFALTGPTGSGKSSIIDALCFALYGTVPRYDDRRLVAPVITQGTLEARVRFDFSLAGVDYTAVRVVRRTGPGRATTKEARLERGDEVLAGDAAGMSREVERLLGLTFEHFTKCVVLPQGAFARFLHDKPSERQDLLVRLLDLGVYERMAARAKTDSAAAEGVLAVGRQRLEQLAFATPSGAEEAEARIAALTGLRHEIVEAQPRLDALAESARLASQQHADAVRAAGLLASVRVSEGVADLSARLVDARRGVDVAEEESKAAGAALDGALTLVSEFSSRADLEAARRDHTERDRQRALLGPALSKLQDAEQAEEEARSCVEQAELEVSGAEEALEAARRSHAALHLTRTLVAGGDCPVCAQPVANVPEVPPAPDLDDGERGAVEARDRLATLRRELRAAERGHAEADAGVVTLRRRLVELDDALAGRPESVEVERLLVALADAEQAVAAARKGEADARGALQARRQELTDLAGAEQEAWRRFDEARDRVAQLGLGPPAAERRSVAADWDRLAGWAAGALETQHELAASALTVRGDAERRRDELVAAVAAACGRLGVEPAGGSPLVAVVQALVQAEAARDRIVEALAEAGQLRTRLAKVEAEAAVARTLGRHLGARGFEQWLLDEALGRLVDGATTFLHQLSGGQYSLTLDDNGGFGVIDHRDADERRGARTLSGGETFLASLALALALADQLGELAARGSARLEALFLDEGFGTLDPDTLDVVRTAIEELGAGGRMVGLVTHVRELADQVPVRFEVRKGPRTATVERVNV